MVDTPSEYLWSSWYRMMGDNPVPEWLAVEQTLLRFATTRTKALSLEKYKQICSTRNDAIIAAFKSGGYSQKEIGDYFTLHYSMNVPNRSKKTTPDPDYKRLLKIKSYFSGLSYYIEVYVFHR